MSYHKFPSTKTRHEVNICFIAVDVRDKYTCLRTEVNHVKSSCPPAIKLQQPALCVACPKSDWLLSRWVINHR